MPQGLQAKLLRALQEGEIEPLGSNKLIRFDVRVIAATSRDLARMVQQGRFREDLFYRLNVLPIRVPPLRDRSSDIPALVEVLGEDMALRSGVPQAEVSAEAIALLAAQHWRGNIRELRNVLEQAAMLSDSPLVGVEQVEAVLAASGVEKVASAPLGPTGHVPAPDPARDPSAQVLRPLAEQVAEVEQQAIAAAMAACDGNKVAAAKLLGMSRAKLYSRLG